MNGYSWVWGELGLASGEYIEASPPNQLPALAQVAHLQNSQTQTLAGRMLFFFFFFFGRMLTAHSRTALSPLAKETVLGKLTMEGGGEGALGTSPGENIWLKNFY